MTSGGEQSSGSFGIPSRIFRFGKLEKTLKERQKKKQKLRKIIVGNVENKTGTDKKETMDSNISKIDLGGWKS